MQSSILVKDLVLVGGGHVHVHVLKSLRARPEPGVRVTLVTRDARTPYSGMLPGLIAGYYQPDEAHIDLYRLARACGARLIQAEAVGLDPERKLLQLRDRPALRYDVISLDTGSTPRLDVPGAAEHALPVKPVAPFLAAWDRTVEQARIVGRAPRIVVVGGGAGGAETALSLAERLNQVLPGAILSISLLSRTTLLPRFNDKARRLLRAALVRRGIAVVEGAEIVSVEVDRVVCADRRAFPCEHVLWVTWAGAPFWLRDTGLALDASGFVAVEPTLRSISHPDVFAAGDVAAVLAHPREKAGVYAVRQGPPLTGNLRRALRGEPLKPFKPQRTALALVGTGRGQAVAVRGPLAFEGRLVWRAKEAIDRRWIRSYQHLRPISMPLPSASAQRDALPSEGSAAAALTAALRRLRDPRGPRGLAALDAPGGAAIVPSDGALLQTVHQFRRFVDDPWLFGRIAAQHALGGIVAMNGRPTAAVATVGVPPMASALLEEDLFQMLAGCSAVLEAQGARLVDGHCAQAVESSLGIQMTGEALPEQPFRKSGLRPGDRLILTKALGTGAILAGARRGEARAEAMEFAVRSMLASSSQSVAMLVAHGARACTHVAASGLAGHLDEMLRVSGVGARIALASVPALPGALDLVATGIVVTPHEAKAQLAVSGGVPGDPRFELLFDPQTAGGLLAGVPEPTARACLAGLLAAGIEAAIIGIVEAQPGLRVE